MVESKQKTSFIEFQRLQFYIEYKAKLKGLPAESINPKDLLEEVWIRLNYFFTSLFTHS